MLIKNVEAVTMIIHLVIILVFALNSILLENLTDVLIVVINIAMNVTVISLMIYNNDYIVLIQFLRCLSCYTILIRLVYICVWYL